MRADGVLVRPGVGALVYQGDTIETGADGAVGITFIDGTVFNLSTNLALGAERIFLRAHGHPQIGPVQSVVECRFSFVAAR